jgi:hypothetical protein
VLISAISGLKKNDFENKSYKKAIVVEMIFEANESII